MMRPSVAIVLMQSVRLTTGNSIYLNRKLRQKIDTS